MTAQADLVRYQGRYAGSVSRFVAYAIDLVVSSAVFSLALAAISYVSQIVTGHTIHWNRSTIAMAIAFVVWEFVYFGYSWAVSGRSLGMAVLGVRVVARRRVGRAAETGDHPRAGVPAQLPALRPGLPRHPGAA